MSGNCEYAWSSKVAAIALTVETEDARERFCHLVDVKLNMSGIKIKDDRTPRSSKFCPTFVVFASLSFPIWVRVLKIQHSVRTTVLYVSVWFESVWFGRCIPCPWQRNALRQTKLVPTTHGKVLVDKEPCLGSNSFSANH